MFSTLKAPLYKTMACLTMIFFTIAITSLTGPIAHAAGKSVHSPVKRQSGIQHTESYKTVNGDDLDLHIWKPRGSVWHRPRPAIVFYHGGGWKHGSWRDFERQARYFASRGAVTVSADYRTEGPVSATVDGIDAMNYVFDHSRRLGIDKQRVVAAAGSAGGEIALATLRNDLPHSEAENKPSAIVLYNPVTDTTGSYPNGWGRDQFSSDEQAKRYSPFHHIHHGDPRTLIMQGTGDQTVSFHNSSRFVKRMRSLDNRANLITYDGAPHAFFNHDRYFTETVRQTDRFLVSLHYLSGHQTIRSVPDQIIDNGSFSADLSAWSPGPATSAKAVHHPVHTSPGAARLSGRAESVELRQDITRQMKAHGAGEYYIGAWLLHDHGANSNTRITVTIWDSGEPKPHSYELPSEELTGKRFVHVSGTRTINWSGKLEHARLEITGDPHRTYVDDASAEYLWNVKND